MIPNPEQLEAISHLREGDLGQIPFAVLLHALALAQRSAVLEIERKPIKKEIILEHGVPVDCRSNLLHETLGRFMVEQGRLDEEQYQACLARSVTQGLQMGEALILDGVLDASELYKILQQNLARKLLDGFTLRSGEFRLRGELPQVVSPLKVKVPQLVVTGILRFTPQDEVNAAIGPLVGQRLFLHPAPPYPLEEIRLQPAQQPLTELLRHGKRIDELAAETTVPFEDIMRLLYSLAVIGIVVPEDRLPRDIAARASAKPPVAAPAPVPVPVPVAAAPAAVNAPAVPPQADIERLRNRVMETYLGYRKQDALDLLGLSDDATAADVERGFLEFSRRFAPWQFAAPGLTNLVEKAEDLFLAGGRAFGELCDVERRNALLVRRQNLREERRKKPDTDRFAIRSELLDPTLQFRKGKALMEGGQFREALQQLQFAYDCDPQNSIYRAELAYCRYLDAPEFNASKSLDELREIVRIDPRCGLAHFYSGEIHRERGENAPAEGFLHTALKLMQGDRRPIESLKALGSKKSRF